jgi:putative acetyltransferase
MGQTLPRVGLRPYLPADAALLAAIFAQSVEGLTGDDYSESQQQAWIASADNEQEFGATLSKQLTLVATLQSSPVGFASLRGANHIEMLYVHPATSRQGVASALYDALEKLATARGTAALTVDASDTAHEFFLKRGYVDQQRSTISVGDEWLARTRMLKVLKGSPKGTVQ